MAKPRKLTKFLCREMLFEYQIDKLDESRKESVRSFIEQDSDLKEELEELKKSIEYCNQLAKTDVSQSFLAEMAEQKSSVHRMTEKLQWKNWPEFLKWSTEAFVIAVAAIAIAIFMPWGDIRSFFSPTKTISGTTIAKGTQDINADLKKQNADQTTKVDQEKEVTDVGESKTKIADAKDSSNEDKQIESKPDLKSVEAKSADSTSAKSVAAKNTETKVEKIEPKEPNPLKGVLYRAFMSHDSVDKITPEIVEKIKGFGGVKAGEVKLGWRKTNGSYFHLKMGEIHYDALLDYLNTYSAVRIYKDPHWRVMPEGQIRIILWVEQK